ncbi:MAG: hypothetical protein LBP87_01825 [Planctomycetaceae bacterium]|jgi:hypothetical protein|nr:hypothetical protein [Planctomycetaceae bacterium]
MKHLIYFLCLFLLPATVVAADDWKIVSGKIITEFAKEVDPQNPLPEYPRPQLVRKTWSNLNGLWDYAITNRNTEGDPKSDPRSNTGKLEKTDGKILVPYPIESALSGVGKTVGKDKKLWYSRQFEIPKEKNWNGQRILLHFGAADWDTTVFVNNKEVGKHVGGYSPFTFDITDALKPEGKQELVVAVFDPTDDHFQPRGKQIKNPHGIWYTAVTGIWDTVWLEPVPATAIEKLKFVPNIKDATLTIEAAVKNLQDGDLIEAKASFKSTTQSETNKQTNQRGVFGRRIFRQSSSTSFATVKKGQAGEPLVLPITNPKLWSPDEPNLYDLTVSIIRNGQVVDSVDSYFGMREISLGKTEDGITRMLLNGKFLFQHGPLDQGWWPDGLYTAPTDAALAYDLEITKKLGFNMLRKHVKVEPLRFYAHCDRLGLLVWQDMPSGDKYIGVKDPDIVRTPESAANYEREWKEIIETRYNAPSIVVWVPFNEGWGQFDTCRILDLTKQLDPTRLVDGPSGWSDRGCGDLYDKHQYRGPGMFPPEEKRATVLGEYGGLGLPVKGHTWVESDKNWGYGGNLKDKDDLLQTYKQLNQRLHPLIAQGLSAAVYTQTTDVEVEVNGLMTYDRVVKVDVEKFKKSNDALHYPVPKVKTLIPTAAVSESEWAYTTDKPSNDWEKAEFDDKTWKKGKGGFGTASTPNTTVRTEWKTNDIWIRKSFDLSAADVKDPSRLTLDLYHDEDAEVFINGVKVLEVKSYISNYGNFPLDNAAKAFKAGKNVIAIHCKQTSGGQYIDAGISHIAPTPKEQKRIW